MLLRRQSETIRSDHLKPCEPTVKMSCFTSLLSLYIVLAYRSWCCCKSCDIKGIEKSNVIKGGVKKDRSVEAKKNAEKGENRKGMKERNREREEEKAIFEKRKKGDHIDGF